MILSFKGDDRSNPENVKKCADKKLRIQVEFKQQTVSLSLIPQK